MPKDKLKLKFSGKTGAAGFDLDDQRNKPEVKRWKGEKFSLRHLIDLRHLISLRNLFLREFVSYGFCVNIIHSIIQSVKT